MKCDCRACGESFGGETAFKARRTGDFTHEAPNYGRRCLTRQEMKAKGWFQNEAGRWAMSEWDKNYRLPICRASTGGDQAPAASEAGVAGGPL